MIEGLRLYYSINCNFIRILVVKEFNYNLDIYVFIGRIKVVEKEVCNVESNRKKEMEFFGFVVKSELVFEVEVLLVRLRVL